MIQEDINPDAVLPVTLISTEELSDPDLDGFLKGLEYYDDVYSSEFAFALVEKPGANETKRDIGARRASPAGRLSYTVQVTESRPEDSVKSSPFSDLPTGPYILHGKELHQAYRIYEDELGAFSAGIVSENHLNFDQYVPLPLFRNKDSLANFCDAGLSISVTSSPMELCGPSPCRRACISLPRLSRSLSLESASPSRKALTWRAYPRPCPAPIGHLSTLRLPARMPSTCSLSSTRALSS